MIVCMTMLGPLSRLWVISCDVDIGPLAKVMPENESGLAPAMGLDGAVWRSGSTDMGLNQNQRLCGLLMVWEIAENVFDSADRVFLMVVVHLSGMRKSMEDQLCLILCVK